MRAFVFATVFLAAVLAASASPYKKEHKDWPVVYGYKQGDKCPAENFYDDCNTCHCSNDGHYAACTRMGCLPRNIRSLNLPHIDNFHEVQECTPGQMFYDICNVCNCTADGKNAACTLMGCPPVEVPHIDGYKAGGKCPAGKTFLDQCNSCKCGEDGVSALCTLKACPGYA